MRLEQNKDVGGRRASRGEAIASHYVEKTYTSTDVLLCDPHTTDVLDVLYHCSLRSDKCVAVLCTYNT